LTVLTDGQHFEYVKWVAAFSITCHSC